MSERSAATAKSGAPSTLRLSARAARVLYNVADAWAPPRGEAPGGGDIDLVPPIERRLESPRGRLKLELLLALLEWEPRLRLRSRLGFAWLARPERQALLAGWESSPLAVQRRAAAWLRELVEAGLGEACRAAAAPSDRTGAADAPQSFVGP